MNMNNHALSLMSKFWDKIFEGAKTTTIRRNAVPYKAGDTITFWENAKELKGKLATVSIKKVTPIKAAIEFGYFTITINGLSLSDYEAKPLAKADGFRTVQEFYGFFQGVYGITETNPFYGVLIEFELIEIHAPTQPKLF